MKQQVFHHVNDDLTSTYFNSFFFNLLVPIAVSEDSNLSLYIGNLSRYCREDDIVTVLCGYEVSNKVRFSLSRKFTNK